MAFRLYAKLLFATTCALLLASFNASAKKTEIISSGLRFEANQGQADPRINFLSQGEGYSLSLSATHSELTLRNSGGRAVVRMNLAGSNPEPAIRGVDKLSGVSNYFLGNDPENWRTDIPNYAKVEYRSVYPGIDLVYYGNEGNLEYDFIVGAGANPRAIKLGFEGIQKSTLDKNGDLVLKLRGGNIRLHRPVTYQEINGARQTIESSYVLMAGHKVGFRIGNYDPARPLVIDPILTYSSYFSGSGGSLGRSIALDSSNNIYIIGNAGDGLPMPNPPPATPSQQPAYITNSAPAFVAKFTSNGTLVYSTYLGGTTFEEGRGIAVDPLDPAGFAYVTGETYSRDFPTKNPLPGKASPRLDQTSEAFVSKLDSNGRLVYSTYLGGSSGDDGGKAITVDALGRAYVAGFTFSDNFPVTPNAFQSSRQGSYDAFVTILEYSGASGILSMRYSTYLGGDSDDQGFALVTDPLTGNVYVTGKTASSNFPSFPPQSPLYPAAGHYDAFVTVLNPNSLTPSTALLFSTYLGGSGADEGTGIRVDATGNMFVTGQTFSPNFPTTPNAFQGASSGLPDLFVTKINPAGTATVYSTYLGGMGRDEVFGIALAVDSSGSAYVGGHTTSLEFPLMNPYQATNDARQGTGFISKFDPTGSSLQFSTFLGGTQYDSVNGVTVDATGRIYVTGDTMSTDFPVSTNPRGRPYPPAAQTSAFVAVMMPPVVVPVLSGLSFNPTSVPVSTTTTGTVTIAAAHTDDVLVTLKSSDTNILMVPVAVTIPAGQTTATFVGTAGLSQGTVTVTAALGLVKKTADVTVTPAPSIVRTISSFSFSPALVAVGQASTGTIVLSGPVATTTTISLTGMPGGAPVSVTVETDQTSVSFAANTSTTGTYTVTARLGDSTKQATLTVVAPPTHVAVATFDADVNINVRPGKDDIFLVHGSFKLGPGSNGINPPSETVVLRVGSLTTTIPAGSFKAKSVHGHDKDDDEDDCDQDHGDNDDVTARFTFKGKINGVDLHIEIHQKHDGSYRYFVHGRGHDFTGVTRPVPVELTIGQDKGVTSDPKAKIH